MQLKSDPFFSVRQKQQLARVWHMVAGFWKAGPALLGSHCQALAGLGRQQPTPGQPSKAATGQPIQKRGFLISGTW